MQVVHAKASMYGSTSTPYLPSVRLSAANSSWLFAVWRQAWKLGWNCSLREMANKPWQLPRTSVEDGCGVYGQEERGNSSLPSQFAVTQPNSRRADDSSSHRPTGVRTRDNGKEGGREKPTRGRNKQQVAKKSKMAACRVTCRRKSKRPSEFRSQGRPDCISHISITLNTSRTLAKLRGFVGNLYLRNVLAQYSVKPAFICFVE